MELRSLKGSLENKLRGKLKENNFKIEKVKKSDFETLIKIYERAYENLKEYAEVGKENILKYLNWLYNQDKEGFFIAKLNNKIVGFICADKNWSKKRGEIHEFVVDPDYQNLGIGKKLFEKALDYLKKANKEEIGLWVGEKNIKAKKFYEKYGFKFKGKIKIWEKYIKEIAKK